MTRINVDEDALDGILNVAYRPGDSDNPGEKVWYMNAEVDGKDAYYVIDSSGDFIIQDTDPYHELINE